MSTPYIPNASPQLVQYGTKDIQLPATNVDRDTKSQHIPLFFLYASQGDTNRQLVGSSARTNLFGAETFDPKKPFYNHQTAFADIANKAGNVCVLQRVIPDDAGPYANACLWLDVLETTVNVLKRNPDGSIFTDANGAQIVTGTTKGYKIKFVKTTRKTPAELLNFGTHEVVVGNQTDSATGAVSARYPILEVQNHSIGRRGNDVGFKIWTPNYAQTQSVPGRLMAESRTFPYYFMLMKKPDAKSTANIVYNQLGDTRSTFTLRPGDVDPSVDLPTYIGDNLLDQYRSLDNRTGPATFGDLGDIRVYQENIDSILEMFHLSEIPFIDTSSDFTTEAEDKYLVNIFTGRSSQNVPYNSIQFAMDPDSVRLSENTIVYLESGSDGTMNNTLFAELVEREMARYLDPNDKVQDMATNPETHVYDSGFPIKTKYTLAYVLANRRDVTPCLSTYEIGSPVLNNTEEYSIAASLKARLQNYPESEIFGLPASRGIVMGNSGKLRDSSFKKRVPVLAHVLYNACRKYGSSDGKWNSSVDFTGQPASLITTMYDISGIFISSSVRAKFWDASLNWVQAENVRESFIPAIRTVHPNDSSILNSFPTTVIISTLNKISHRIWRQMAGSTSLRDNEFIARISAMAEAETRGIFGDEYIINPHAELRSTDVVRGYSWTLYWSVRGPAMRTVMTTWIETGVIGVQ